MAKNATSNAFIAGKKRREEQANLGISKASLEKRSDNTFEEQHHHLLACLEHATVSVKNTPPLITIEDLH
jgi:hypothetical protein